MRYHNLLFSSNKRLDLRFYCSSFTVFFSSLLLPSGSTSSSPTPLLPKMAPKRQRTQTECQPLSVNESKYFSNTTQREIFENKYKERGLLQPKILDVEFLRDEKFQFLTFLNSAGLTKFLSSPDDVYPDLTRVFYCNLQLKNGVLSSEVCHQTITLTAADFGSIIGVPSEGPSLLLENPATISATFDRSATTASLLTDPTDACLKEITAKKLTVENRLLHYTICKCLFPRRNNTSQLLKQDVVLMWVLQNNYKVNWAALIMQHMYDSKAPGPLPLAHIVTRILSHYDFDLSEEKNFSAHEFSSMFTKTTLNQMQLVFRDGKWIHKPGASKKNPTLEIPLSPLDFDLLPDIDPSPPESNSFEMMQLLQTILTDIRNNTAAVNGLSNKVDGLSNKVDGLRGRMDSMEALLASKDIIIDSPIRPVANHDDVDEEEEDDDED